MLIPSMLECSMLTRPTQTLSDHDSLKQRLASVQAMLNDK